MDEKRDPLEELLVGFSPAPPREGAKERVLGPALEALDREDARPRRRFGFLLQAAALAACLLISLGVDAWLSRRLDRALPPSRGGATWAAALTLHISPRLPTRWRAGSGFYPPETRAESR